MKNTKIQILFPRPYNLHGIISTRMEYNVLYESLFLYYVKEDTGLN